MLLLLLLWELCKDCRKRVQEVAPVELHMNQGFLFEDDSLKHLSIRLVVVVEKAAPPPPHFRRGRGCKSVSDLRDYWV